MRLLMLLLLCLPAAPLLAGGSGTSGGSRGPATGTNLSSVRVHSNSPRPASTSARAYTSGSPVRQRSARPVSLHTARGSAARPRPRALTQHARERVQRATVRSAGPRGSVRVPAPPARWANAQRNPGATGRGGGVSSRRRDSVQSLASNRTGTSSGPGQERHLPHEAWHVVQQTQGRVRPASMH